MPWQIEREIKMEISKPIFDNKTRNQPSLMQICQERNLDIRHSLCDMKYGNYYTKENKKNCQEYLVTKKNVIFSI